MKIACKLFFHCHCKFWFSISQNAAEQKLNFCELLPDTMFTIRYGMPRSLLNSSALLIISSNISHDLFSKGEVRTNCSIWETQFMTKIRLEFFKFLVDILLLCSVFLFTIQYLQICHHGHVRKILSILFNIITTVQIYGNYFFLL